MPKGNVPAFETARQGDRYILILGDTVLFRNLNSKKAARTRALSYMESKGWRTAIFNNDQLHVEGIGH